MTSSPWPIVLVGHLRAGKVLFSQKALAQLLRGRQDCPVEITIERKHATRSGAQNRMYWGFYVHLISEHTGYTPDEVHDLLKTKFLPKKLAVADQHGEVTDEFVVGGSTAKLNKIEFGEYLERIQIWATETLGVVVPDPPQDTLDDRKGRQQVSA
jgi:hypothetical protein